jgi:hypothetical protein
MKKGIYRHIYRYICLGCNHARWTYIYTRYLAAKCTKCQKNVIPDNQSELFPREEATVNG